MARGVNGIKRIGVMTGGGDCPGLNAVIRAVTKTAIYKYGLEVVGVKDGFLGLIENRMEDLTHDSASGILTQGGTILGTTNKANPSHHPVKIEGKTEYRDVRDQCVANAREHGVEVLVVIGGDGTMSAANGLLEKGLSCVGVPKTIDNDIVGTEITFGFNTAVVTATEALDKVHTTASSHHRVMVVEVMGRYAGWIALHAGVASGSDVILLPELEYELDVVCNFVKERSRYGRSFSIICVGEGAKEKGGEVVVARRVEDSPEPVRLGGVSVKLADDIEERTGVESRAVVFGHVQRGGTPSPLDRVLATGFGYYALEQVVARNWNTLVVRQNYGTTTVPIASVANKTRTVPLDHPLVEAARGVKTCFGTREM